MHNSPVGTFLPPPIRGGERGLYYIVYFFPRPRIANHLYSLESEVSNGVSSTIWGRDFHPP